MTKVQQEILLSLIEEYAILHKCKAMSEDRQYSYEWREAANKEAARDIPIIKRRIKMIIEGLL